MNNVAVLDRGPKGYRLTDEVMMDLRLRMYEFDAKDLADITGLSTGCLYAIRRGKTKWPRGTTLFLLLDALQIDFYLVDRRTGRALR